jgi:hypothetical protein
MEFGAIGETNPSSDDVDKIFGYFAHKWDEILGGVP